MTRITLLNEKKINNTDSDLLNTAQQTFTMPIILSAAFDATPRATAFVAVCPTCS